MENNISRFLPILCVCFTVIYCNHWVPRVWPETFVEDGKPFIEFTCGAFLKSEEWLSWYSASDGVLTTIEQQYDGYRTINLQWPLAGLQYIKIYCAKENDTYWSFGNQYWAKTLSKFIHIKIKKEIKNPMIDEDTRPWLTPAAFVDNGRKVIEYTCYAHLTKWKTLSWYQLKDKSVSKLGMIQQEMNYGYVKITLEKTLEQSDNGSEIYCSKDGQKFKESERILITFERHIEALETPYVTVEPSADVAFFDEGDRLEFVCSGSTTVDGRALTWYLQTPDIIQVPPRQNFYKSTNQNFLTLPIGSNVVDHGKLLYCAQDFTLILSGGAASSLTNYGELARSRTITLLHRAQCNKKDKPRVTPEKFEDEDEPFIQLTCYAFLELGQLLSWYQSKGLNKSDDSLLIMIQLQNPKAGEWMVLTLTKTLEASDNNSEIYCTRQSVLPDGSFLDILSESKRIPLTFHRDIPPLERPSIQVEPNTTTVCFKPNTTLRLTCSGSKPADGRNYTWFKNDSESGLTVPKDQKYDASTNFNVLDLPLNEFYKMELFCAQGFLTYIRLADSLRVKTYGQLVVSNIITLIQRDKHETQNCSSWSSRGNTNLILSVTIPVALLALVTAAAACWLRRRRTARPAPPAPAPPAPAPAARGNDDYGDYVNVSREITSPQVTYAVLELPKNGPGAARAPPAPEPALYAEIACVYKR